MPPMLRCLQVSCNDWCLRHELSSAYLLECLNQVEQDARLGPGFAEDRADTWIESDYFCSLPRTLQEHAAWRRPWLEQPQVGLQLSGF